MVTAMGIEKHAEYYRGYQPDDRSIWPVAIVLATMVALWLLVYLIAAVGGPSPLSRRRRSRRSPPTEKFLTEALIYLVKSGNRQIALASLGSKPEAATQERARGFGRSAAP